MPNWFNRKLTLPRVQHSINDLSNSFKTSFNIGQLVPTYIEDMLPSDKFVNFRQDHVIRLAPLTYALMHRIKIHQSHFFTPYRIILGDELYEKWLNNKVDFAPMVVSVPGEADTNPFENSIYDFLGIPPSLASYDEGSETWSLSVANPLPFLSYLCIVRDWYLDSNIQSSEISSLDDVMENYRQCCIDGETFDVGSPGGLEIELTTFQVSYSKDYFNTARPQPELGTEMFVLNRPLNLVSPTDGKNFDVVTKYANRGEYQNNIFALGAKDGTTGLSPDGTLNETTTIKDLWRKEMLQQYYQIDNQFGSRIREKIAGHYGVEISDKRIMIPRYVGGSSDVVKIQEVIQTSTTTDESALGFAGGRGMSVGRGKKHQFFCEEHGIFMSLISLIPDNGYCNGMDRMYFKKNIFDFASPEFNNIGWQEIYNGELYADGSSADKGTFGYQPRYSEYRSHPSRCAGAFRNEKYLRWHLDRNFASLPPLNSNFLKVADTDRIFNYDGTGTINAESCFVNVWTEALVSRPISKEPDSIHIY